MFNPIIQNADLKYNLWSLAGKYFITKIQKLKMLGVCIKDFIPTILKISSQL